MKLFKSQVGIWLIEMDPNAQEFRGEHQLWEKLQEYTQLQLDRKSYWAIAAIFNFLPPL